MEIEQLRKELNHLLENVIEYSQDLSEQTHIPSLEISVVLAKVNKMQENLIVLRHLLQEQENQKIQERKKRNQIVEPPTSIPPRNTYKKDIPLTITNEEVIHEEVVEEEKTVLPEETKEEKSSNEISIVKEVPENSIKRITDAFSLNDRYLYANELFDKNMSAFNECIKEVEGCRSLEEVNQILLSTQSQFNLDEENEQFINFSEIVKRNFL